MQPHGSGAPLRDLEKTIRQFYADLGLKYNKVFRDTLPDTMQTYYDRAVEEMKKAGKRNAILGKPDSGRIKYFLDNSMEYVAMKTQNMSFQHIKELRAMSADVLRQMSITGATRKQVSREMMNRAMQIPGFQFIDKAGNKWANKSYFSMLARTELMNAARASYEDKCAEEGFDVMKLSTSGHSCGACSRFEGRLFSLTGKTAGLPSKQDLIDAGVFHPNCTHSYSLVPDAVIERDYNADGTRKTEWSEKAKTEEKYPSGEKTLTEEEKKQQRNYDETRDNWYQRIIEAGGSKEIAAELADLYTPEMYVLGTPPNVGFIPKKFLDTIVPHYNNTLNTLFLHNEGSYNTPSIRVHEFTHWWHYRVQEKYPQIREELKTAAKKDLDMILELYSSDMRDFMGSRKEARNKAALDLLHLRNYDLLNEKQKKTVFLFFNSVGSVSDGTFGGWHGDKEDPDSPITNRKYFYAQNHNEGRVSYGEVVAELVEDDKALTGELKFAFPEIWSIVKKYNR